MAWAIPAATMAVGVASKLLGGSGPHINPYKPGRGSVEDPRQWAWKDIRRLRRGGIMDPALDYLGYGPDWRPKVEQKIRDASAGEQLAAEERIATPYRSYGVPAALQGSYYENLSRLRSNRTTAIEAALRDLELQEFQQRWSHLFGMQGNYRGWQGQLAGQFNQGETMAYRAALDRYNARKQMGAQAGQAVATGLAGGAFTPSAPASASSV